jgi:hypothetical protein
MVSKHDLYLNDQADHIYHSDRMYIEEIIFILWFNPSSLMDTIDEGVLLLLIVNS